MELEIERKFLVRGEAWRREGQGIPCRQGYLCSSRERTVRVRVAGDKAFLTIKGLTVGTARPEYEYEIPRSDGLALLESLTEKPIIEKTRYTIRHGGCIWEIDEFHGANQGLVVAEIELEHEDQRFDMPDWIGVEVTGDPRYCNSHLVRHPFSAW